MKPFQLQQRQQVLFRLLVQLDAYCNKHDLRYYLAGGTLLGAVRHKGFIPWDDDVDVYMPRPDFERLIKSNAIAENAKIVTASSPDYYHPFNFCNITDTETIMVEHTMKRQTKKGVSIDIFPMDGLPDEEKERKRHLRRLLYWQSVLTVRIMKPSKKLNGKNLIKNGVRILSAPFSVPWIVHRIDCIAKKYPFASSQDVTHSVLLFGNPKRFIVPRAVFDTSVLMEFEQKKLHAPIGWKTILERSYGDYQKLPPEQERQEHHGIDIFLKTE